MAPDNPDPLFWPLLFVTLLASVFVVGVVMVVKVLARRDPGHHPQQAQGGGVNFHDASSRTSNTFNVGEVNVKSPSLPGSDG